MWKTTKDDVRILGCCSTVGENITPRSCEKENFPEARLLRDILAHGDEFFIVCRCEERQHTLSLLQGAYELSKVVTLGPESSHSRTVSLLGRTWTLRQWRVEYEPHQQHVSRALKVLGLTDARGVASLGTDDVGGLEASEISEYRRTAK